jgi:hypothetical protein
MADALLIKTLVVILASVSAISLVARARLPAAAGYLLAGLVIGPHGLQLIATSDETRFLAELGIIFLMFMWRRQPASRLHRFDGGGTCHAGGYRPTHRGVARRRSCNVIDRHHP